ncbi:MAG: class I SAM-dependent methyltransferase [Nocardioidaceae bacterium]
MDAEDWDARYADHDTIWGLEPNRFVREQCERLPVGEALDLACGEGRNAVWLAQLGWRVTGVDFSAVAIQRARAWTSELAPLVALHLHWRVGDVTTLTPKPRSVDLVLVSYLHLPAAERDRVLARASQALRPGGHLVLVGHDLRNLAEGVSGPQDPALLYEPESLRRMLSSTGRLVVEVARTAERPTPAGVALDTVVRARRA